MSVDWTNPESVNRFRQNAQTQGVNSDEIDSYVENKLKATKETRTFLEPSTSGDIGIIAAKDLALAKTGFNLIGQVAQMYEEDPGVLTKQLVPGKFFSRKFDSAVYDMADALLRLRTGAQANPTEIRGYMKTIAPSFGDSKEVVKYKLDKMKQDFANYMNPEADAALPEVPTLESNPTQAVSTQPETIPQTMNVAGLPSQPGDLVKSQNGQMTFSGTPEDLITYKSKKYGSGEITGQLVKWLAESEALPIFGSIAGGIAGAGLGSIATGAAGALAGKATQQALKEMIDPEKQTLSDAAKAVVVEGITDAAFGTVGLGIGWVVGKGGRVILTKLAGNTAEEVAGTGVKELTKSQKPLAEWLKITKDDIVDFQTYHPGESLIGKIEDLGVSVSPTKQAEIYSKALEASKARLNEALSGKTVSVKDVVSVLEDSKKSLMGNSLHVPIELKPVADLIDDRILTLQEIATKVGSDSIPATELDNMIQGFNKVFQGEAYKGTSKEAQQILSGKLRVELRNVSPDIAEAKMDWFVANTAKELGDKSLLVLKDKDFLKWYEGVGLTVGGPLGPSAVLIKKIFDTWRSNPLFRSKIFAFMANTSQKFGDKAAYQAVINEGIKSGIIMDVAPSLLKRSGGQTIEAIMANPPESQLPATPQPLEPGGGGLPMMPGMMPMMMPQHTMPIKPTMRPYLYK